MTAFPPQPLSLSSRPSLPICVSRSDSGRLCLLFFCCCCFFSPPPPPAPPVALRDPRSRSLVLIVSPSRPTPFPFHGLCSRRRQTSQSYLAECLSLPVVCLRADTPTQMISRHTSCPERFAGCQSLPSSPPSRANLPSAGSSDTPSAAPLSLSFRTHSFNMFCGAGGPD